MIRSLAIVLGVLVPTLALAQAAPTAPDTPPPPAAAPDTDTDTDADAAALRVTIGGYLEAHYQAHIQNPENRITNLRGFDNRSRTFTLSNVALDVKAERGPLTARVILQVGHTPSTYYLAEPALPGTASVNASSTELWKYLQVANVAAALPGGWGLEAGLFTSPIGPEVMPVKDNAHWSRSNLFVGLPFYHTGVVLSRPLGGGWTGKLHVYNGWNSVVDNNGTPSVALSGSYASADGATTGQLLYFGGVERPTGAPEGAPWRHLFDAYVQRAITPTLTLAAHADAGFERNDLGTSAWAAAALYGKLALSRCLYVAARGDYFRERVAEDGGRAAAAMFWPTTWLASGTLTLAYQPVDGVSARLEYRHDHAASDVFFGGAVALDPTTMAAIPDRRLQDTLLLGVTAWF